MKHHTQFLPLRFWGSDLHAAKASISPAEPPIQPLFCTYKRQGWEVLLYTVWLYFISLHLRLALTNMAVSHTFHDLEDNPYLTSLIPCAYGKDTGGMTQLAKALMAKADDLSLILRTHVIK